MARPLDPFRALEVPRDASLDEVKASYRRLAKLYHPDSAGDRALPRFLAIQAAYEALTEGPGALRLGRAARPRPAGGRTARPSEADTERARATREAAGRGGRMRQPPGGAPGSTGRGSGAGTNGAGTGAGASAGAGAGSSRTSAGPGRGAPRGSAGSAGSAGSTGSSGRAPGSRSGAGSTGRTRRDRRKPSSTSYDGADLEPFEPEWQGASWYGESSGTYWTINPKEFADPRKHGPEYQARGRRAARADRTGPRAASAGPSARRPATTRATRDEASTAEAAGPAMDASPPPDTAEEALGATGPDWSASPPPGDAERFRAPRPAPVEWTAPFAAPAAEPPGTARPPFAVFGVFAILLGAIGTILVLSPAGPASAGFVPIVFLVAILAAAGLVLNGLRGGRRA